MSFPITDPMGIVAVLLGIEGLVLLVADLPGVRRVTNILPAVFWMYFLPMLAVTFGLLPTAYGDAEPMGTKLYSTLSTYVLPGCLVLLLLSADVVGIVRLGPAALAVMLAGALGILVGGPLVLLIMGHWLPDYAWQGLGILSASWIGGSANMLAVKAATDTPDRVYAVMGVVDAIIPYAWMGLMILMAAWQKGYDRWNRSNHGMVEHLTRRVLAEGTQAKPVTLQTVGIMFALVGVSTYACMLLAGLLPAGAMMSPGGWVIILASLLGLALSFTPARRLEASGASRLGYFLLYFVLTSIGARANLNELRNAPLLMVAGALWILIHAGFLVVVGRIVRAPMSLLAAASQANIGGAASAPVVAEAYQPGLAGVGLLMAILGNIIGTWMGLACYWLCMQVKT